MHNAGDSNHLEDSVPVVGLGELLVLFRTPRIGARRPTGNDKVLSIAGFIADQP